MDRETALRGIRAEAMDCLQVNLAVLAEQAHGPGTSTRLGGRPGFEPRWTTPLPTVESTVEERIEQARERLGLVAVPVDDLGRGSVTTYVVGDAYGLPWTPYFRRRHMDHSFLVEPGDDRYVVTDAYHNDTQWGAARPVTLSLHAHELWAALADGATAMFAIIPGPLPDRRGAEGPAIEPAVVRRYVAAYRDHPDRLEALDRLTLETWLLARQHLLHAIANGPEDAALPWQRLAQQTFLASRRVAAGRPEPTGVLPELESLLLGESTPAQPIPVASDARSGAIRARVVAALADVLLLPEERVAAAAVLTDLRGFNSFRLVDVLTQLEAALAVSVPPDQLTAAHLASVDSLTALLLRCTAGTTEAEEALSHA